MDTVSGSPYQLPMYNESKVEDLTFVIDYSATDNSAVSSELYLRHTINSSETDILTSIPTVQTVIGTDSPSVMLSSADTTIGSNEVLQLELAVTAGHTKTVYGEQQYSVMLSSDIPFPFGTKILIGTESYDLKNGNSKVILPVVSEGSYYVTIEVSQRGYSDDFTLTAGLCSAPDARYPYTTATPIVTDSESFTVLVYDSAIKVTLADSKRLLDIGRSTPLDFAVETVDSQNVDTVRVKMYKKDADIGFNYTETVVTDEFSTPTGSTVWNYQPAVPWAEGIYRFVFELLDSDEQVVKSDLINVIVSSIES
ncbi:MAG: hypothetical protein GX800_10220 [Clostridiaceae bacterium]|nr:hypothetical protein [Clostridiaceae bacterium]